MKACRIIDYCFGTNTLNFGIYLTSNGENAAIFVSFIIYIVYTKTYKKNHIINCLVEDVWYTMPCP